MSNYAKAVQRFHRLDRTRCFPRECDRCRIVFNRDDHVSIVEVRDGNPLAMHEACADRNKHDSRVARRRAAQAQGRKA